MKILTIENKSGKIRLNEAVTKSAIDRMIDEIGQLFGATAAASGANFGEIMNCAENAVDTLEIELNSPGGSVFDGYTIYNEIKSLRERGVDVTATITGMCASMASVIAMACNTIRMVPHARMMIHDASNVVGGNADQLRKAADLLDSISGDIAAIYSDRTGKPVDEIRELMKAETWMNAKDAVANGFADTIFDIRAAESKPRGMSIFARLFPNDSETVAKLDAMLEENESIRAELIEAQSRIAELTSLSEVNATLQSEITALTSQVTDATTALETATAEIAAKDAEIIAAKESAGAEAVQILATIGQPEPLAIEQATDKSPKSLVEQYEALQGPEKWAFLAKHSFELVKEARKNSTN